MSFTSFDQKFIHDLGDIYDAEHRFLAAQQDMLSKATAQPLKTMIQEHIAQTQQQIQNLEQAHTLLGQKPKRTMCDAAAGIVTEGQKGMMEAATHPAILDCVINGSASKVEHYEIASYRGLIAAAEEMGNQQLVRLLQQNLMQEQATAQKIEQAEPMLIRQAIAQSQPSR